VSQAASRKLSIERINARYLAGASHPDPKRVRAHLNRSLEGLLAEILALTAGRLLAREDGLWFVRELPVSLELDAGLPGDIVASTVARAVVGSLAREIRGGDATNVIHFADRAAYLSNFVSDCAQGAAWQRWYYRQMVGLKALSTSNAITTALLKDVDDGLMALQRLPEVDLKRVIAALTPADAHRIVEAMGTESARRPNASIWNAAVSSWRSSQYAGAASEAHRSLLVVAGMRVVDSGATALRGACVLAARSLARLHALAAHPAGIDSAAAQALLPAIDANERTSLLKAIGPPAAPAGDAAIGHSSFGGVFLLLNALDDVTTGGEAIDAVLRLHVLARCLGKERCAAVLRDRAWRRILGVDAALDDVELSALLRHGGAKRRRRLERLGPRRPSGSPEVAWLSAIAREQRPEVWIVTDPHGIWCAVVPLGRSGPSPRRLRPVLHDWPATRPLRTSPWLSRRCGNRLRGLPVESCDGGPSEGALASDLDYLGAPTDRWDAVVALLAAQVLRRFAQSLAGFSASGFGYLYANCLDIDADIEWEDDRTVVHLARPALNLILNIAGVNRGKRRMGWLAVPPLALFANR